MSTPQSVTSEILVNTTTRDTQTTPGVTSLGNGGFVVVWWDVVNRDIRGQMLDAGGNSVGGEFILSSTTTGLRTHPAVASLGNGGFVAVWQDSSQTGDDGSSWAVHGQIFDAGGNKVGNTFLANTTTAGAQEYPVVAGLANGGFVVAWQDHSLTHGAISGYDVRAQVFRADGSKAGDEFMVNTTIKNDQELPAITGLGNGGFVVTWQDGSRSGGDTQGDAVRGQVFDANGNKAGGEFLVNTTTQGSQELPSVASLQGGGFVVAWQDRFEVRGQVFDASGGKVEGEFLVNTTTEGAQTNPSVTGLADGGFVVTWQDHSQRGGDTDSNSVRAQVFSASGSKVGEEFVVNATTEGGQVDPSVTALSNGSFVVSWVGNGTGDDNGVFARIFSTGDPAHVVRGTSGNDVLTAPNLPHTIIITAGGNDMVMGGAGMDSVVLPATWSEIQALGGLSLDAAGRLLIPTPLGTVTASDVERLQTSDGTLAATDLALPVLGVTNGSPTGQVLALAYWGFGVVPDGALLNHWVGRASQVNDFGSLAQEVLDAVVPGVSTSELVAHLHHQVAGRSPSPQELEAYAGLVGPGKTFATHGDLYAAVASLAPVPAELMGLAQVLEWGVAG